MTDLTKLIFVSINFAIAPKKYIHKTSYTTSIQKIATDPSSTSHVENYLILLNKLTSKGAVKYLKIRHGEVWCVVCVVRQYWCISVEFSE